MESSVGIANGDAEAIEKLTILERIADFTMSLFSYAGALLEIFFNFWIAFYMLKGSRWNYIKKTIINQVIFSGIDAVYAIGVIAAIVGGVVMVRVLSFSPTFETNAFIMQLLVSLIITELAPILTAVILLGRSGSAVTVELGEMRIKRHHEALEWMGIDIFQYFYVPRIIGLSFSCVILNAYFIIITLGSAVVITAFRTGVDWSSMLTLFVASLQLSDIAIGAVKGLCLGMIIAIVCLHHGQLVQSSATEIPQRTSQAIVNSFRICFLVNGLISFLWYLL